jgi:prepilin-type N-terminal cleavage/methylation domain-containing protein
MKLQTPQHRPVGFSLVEMLVVVAVFSVTTIIVAQIFATVQQAQVRVEQGQDVSESGRFLLEAMSRELRLGTVDYAYYSAKGLLPLDRPQTVLATRDMVGDQYVYRQNGTQLDLCIAPANIVEGGGDPDQCLAAGNGPQWQVVTSEDQRLKELQFYISPSQDPFQFEEDASQYRGGHVQPRVTILLQMEPEEGQSEGQIVTLQTTIVSRRYER